MPRKYELKRRALQREATRRRILDASLALHSTVGPAHTSDAAIAERAGVTRMTFYRHFPDEATLFSACSAHAQALMPPPDPAAWRRVRDPAGRLRLGLTELYAFYRVAGPALVTVARDIPLLRPGLLMLPEETESMRTIAAVLCRGWSVRGRQRRLLTGAIHHAIAVSTWASLVQQQGLSDTDATDLLMAMVGAAGCDRSEGRRLGSG